MPSLADRITAQLQVLVGQPVGDCWRAADMIVFEFGPRRRITNRRGEEIEVGDVRLHIQCPWRLVSPSSLHFGRADVFVPVPVFAAPGPRTAEAADGGTIDGETRLDRLRRVWNDRHVDAGLRVETACGDPYAGFRLEFTGGWALETFPTTAASSCEQWRLLRADGAHFVVSGLEAHVATAEPST
jgi:hypothetical protein